MGPNINFKGITDIHALNETKNSFVFLTMKSNMHNSRSELLRRQRSWDDLRESLGNYLKKGTYKSL